MEAKLSKLIPATYSLHVYDDANNALLHEMEAGLIQELPPTYPLMKMMRIQLKWKRD